MKIIIEKKGNSTDWTTDPKLSWRDRGLLAFLLNYSKDTELDHERLSRENTRDGKGSTLDGLNSLVVQKYIKIAIEGLGKKSKGIYVVSNVKW